MKNKILFFGSLCLILAFAGCSDAQSSTLSSPTGVEVVDLVSATSFKVRCNATDGVARYAIVARQDGKRRVLTISSNMSPTTSNRDKWESSTISIPNLPSKGTYEIGVIALPNNTDMNPSSPAWASVRVVKP
jgi:hypothetical protein